jgi:hypothetical protein
MRSPTVTSRDSASAEITNANAPHYAERHGDWSAFAVVVRSSSGTRSDLRFVVVALEMPPAGLEATRTIAADPALAATRMILTTFDLDEYVF